MQGTFYLYTGIAALGFLLFLWILPETRGKSLVRSCNEQLFKTQKKYGNFLFQEEMEKVFERPWMEKLPFFRGTKRKTPTEKTALKGEN